MVIRGEVDRRKRVVMCTRMSNSPGGMGEGVSSGGRRRHGRLYAWECHESVREMG